MKNKDLLERIVEKLFVIQDRIKGGSDKRLFNRTKYNVTKAIVDLDKVYTAKKELERFDVIPDKVAGIFYQLARADVYAKYYGIKKYSKQGNL